MYWVRYQLSYIICYSSPEIVTCLQITFSACEACESLLSMFESIMCKQQALLQQLQVS